MIVYNPDDDWSYINGIKYQYVGLVWDGYFYNNGVNSKNFQSNHSNFRCSSSSYSINFETNYITISNSAKGVTGNGVGIVSDNVDLSRFNTIYFILKKTAHGNGGFSVAVGERDTMKATGSSIDSTTTYKSISMNTGSNGDYSITIDISDIEVINPLQSPSFEKYVNEFYES